MPKDQNHIIPPQISRLVLVTVAIFVCYFIARQFLVPDSFGEYGWYRANALKDYQKLPVRYAGSAVCGDCHSDVVELKLAGGHMRINCESCHGPQNDHLTNPEVLPGKPAGDFCVRCHSQNPSRPANFPQVNAEEHSAGVACMDCHQAHNPREGL